MIISYKLLFLPNNFFQNFFFLKTIRCNKYILDSFCPSRVGNYILLKIIPCKRQCIFSCLIIFNLNTFLPKELKDNLPGLELLPYIKYFQFGNRISDPQELHVPNLESVVLTKSSCKIRSNIQKTKKCGHFQKGAFPPFLT